MKALVIKKTDPADGPDLREIRQHRNSLFGSPSCLRLHRVLFVVWIEAARAPGDRSKRNAVAAKCIYCPETQSTPLGKVFASTDRPGYTHDTIMHSLLFAKFRFAFFLLFVYLWRI